MRNRVKAGVLIIVLLGIITTVLMGATMVLGMTGSAGASTWTGTAGAVLLAVWLLAINGKRRPRRKRPAPAAART